MLSLTLDNPPRTLQRRPRPWALALVNASALFVSVDGNGKARILGRMNEPQWQRVLASTAN